MLLGNQGNSAVLYALVHDSYVDTINELHTHDNPDNVCHLSYKCCSCVAMNY